MGSETVLTCVREGCYGEAAAAADALDINTAPADILQACATAYERTYQYRKAAECVCLLSASCGHNSEEHLSRALRLLLQTGESERAEEYAEHMRRNGFYNFDYYCGSYRLGQISGMAQAEQIELLKSILEISFEAEYSLELAKLYRQNGQEPECRRLCKKIEIYFGDEVISAQARQILNTTPVSCPIASQPEDSPTAKPSPPETAAVLTTPVRQEMPEQKPKLPEEIQKAFRDLEGMDAVKEQLAKIYNVLWLERQREARLNALGDTQRAHNFVLYGNPGTGKTTVARIIAKLLFGMGVRENGTLVETDRSKIVSQYIGETPKNMKQFIDEAKGGTLFIDEAYNLFKKGNEKDPGLEAIECLLKDMEDHRGAYSVILAGYEKPLKEMLKEANPGFRSRFSYNITIPDYSDNELIKIAEKIATKDKYVLSHSAKEAIQKRIRRERVDDTFGNARFVRELVSEAKMNLATRLSAQTGITDKDLVLLKEEDFLPPESMENACTLDSAMDELQGLTGLTRVKDAVTGIVNSVRARQEGERRGLKLSQSFGTLHMCFKGNPGTGKTTVARLLGKIYSLLGVLKRGDVFVECTRADLIGSYMGHTAERVKKKVSEALGGILFIDEAYSLCTDDHDSFGKEAINSLIAEMENRRDSLMVILAGYSGEMDSFFKVNPGMQSRVNTEILFEDYTPEEMLSIFIYMANKEGYIIADDLRSEIVKLFAKKARERDFGNARGVRNVFEKTRTNKFNSMFADPDSQNNISNEEFMKLRAKDLPKS